MKILISIFWTLGFLSRIQCEATTSLPTVDLGYQVQQATSFNSSGETYTFSNIRYGQAPVGDLRFRAPLPPVGRNTTVNNGSNGVVCAQPDLGSMAFAGGAISEAWVTAYLSGQPFNYSAAVAEAIASHPPNTTISNPLSSEDCLFLDLYVPKKVFDGANYVSKDKAAGAPVMVWIFGGGFIAGDKSVFGSDPAGLIKASQNDGSEGVIFIAINYRLGAFGWLGGEKIRADGVVNAGLYDQRLALQWVKDHITLFGGDPENVTLIGESAGGSSVMLQITAFGGEGPDLFQKALPQSPGGEFGIQDAHQEEVLAGFLDQLNVSTLAEARKLPTSVIMDANTQQLCDVPLSGLPLYGPLKDNAIMPDYPGKLLAEGKFRRNITLMSGHNSLEGLISVPPTTDDAASVDEEVAKLFTAMPNSTREYVTSVLYPPVFDGSMGYTDNVMRLSLLISEWNIVCNNFYLNKALDNKTYGYQFDVFPALHGADVAYTFFNGQTASVFNNTLALAMQSYITSFVKKNFPRGDRLPQFPVYENEANILDFRANNITRSIDPAANVRCDWWQKSLYGV